MCVEREKGVGGGTAGVSVCQTLCVRWSSKENTVRLHVGVMLCVYTYTHTHTHVSTRAHVSVGIGGALARPVHAQVCIAYKMMLEEKESHFDNQRRLLGRTIFFENQATHRHTHTHHPYLPLPHTHTTHTQTQITYQRRLLGTKIC